MYENGYGTPRDNELAELWYSKSADQGYDKAKAKQAPVRRQQEASGLGHEQTRLPQPPSGLTVMARGLSVVPGALICSDSNTVSIVFNLYTTHWEQTMQDKLTNGDSRLLRGPAAPLPDLQAFGCTLIPPGTPMTLERKTPVPVVVVKTMSGETARGVTLPRTIASP